MPISVMSSTWAMLAPAFFVAVAYFEAGGHADLINAEVQPVVGALEDAICSRRVAPG